MNDPGLDQAAQKAAQDIERNGKDRAREKAQAEQREFLDPTCPLIAGTFGPIANAFSICALVEKWRVHIPSGSDEGHGTKVEDPKWLIAVNSISLVFALVANIALLLNMTRRLSFAIAQPITIVGWFLASFLLMALVSVASTSVFRIEPMIDHALSQAYYYAIMAAIIYFIISCLMIFTVFGAYREHYPKEFRLRPSQRTLMLQTISFMFYLLIGALVFSKIEGWDFLDGVYWADFTLLTVGIGGDYVPSTHAARSLLFPYAIGGAVMVGLVIGSIRSLILERGKEKLSARFVEVKREKVLGSIDEEERTVKLGLFEKMHFSEKGLSEAQRREQEFRIMRRIQEKSEKKRRYTALAISSTAALLLWFLGALVFMHSEKPQGWTYFMSLYFAYTSLLTIGYGDLTLSSNSGKAFFVFWSLMAVPTLTISISNMGDTVIKGFSDLTIWIGSMTVLPEEDKSLRSTLRIGLQKLRVGKLYNPDKKNKTTYSHDRYEQKTLSRLAEYIEAEELYEAEEAGKHGDDLERDIRFYHYVLAKELRELLGEVNVSPPRKYKYEDWSYYLRLLGQDENDASAHRKAQIEPIKATDGRPDLGIAYAGKENETWSWLGIKSPLMGNQNEAEWLLQRLSVKLDREMMKMRMGKREPPPVSMADLRGRDSSKDEVSKKEREKLRGDVDAAEIRRRARDDDVNV